MKNIKGLYNISRTKLFVMWLSITAISFVLSEMGSLYDRIQGIMSLIEDYKILIVNGVFCALFSAVSIVCSYSFLCYQALNPKIKKAHLAAVAIIILFLNFFISLIIDIAYDHVFPSYASPYLLDDVYDSCLVSSLCSFIFTMHFYGQVISVYERERKSDAIRLLKFQLNPHFVFNSLNILIGLIEINPREAERFAINISKIYRYVTKSIGKNLVTIEEAFFYAKYYCDILQSRYPDSIDYEVKNAVNGYIVPMALQVLIENAVKHNAPSSVNKLYIDIECDSNYVVVSNNIIKNLLYSKHAPSEGVGLSNIFKQYSLMEKKRPLLKNENGFFRVYLPIIKEIENYVQNADY